MKILPTRNTFAMTDGGVIVDAEAYYSCVYQALIRARRYVLIAGWQFDTEVALLRGEAATAAPYPVRWLELLNALAQERPELRIYILAWDYSLIYSLEREWMQGLKFSFQASPSIHFEFDPHPDVSGSHHQKFVVVDGVLGFVGGLDICDERWDNREHLHDFPLRTNTSGEPARPNHELQSFVRGPIVSALVDVFCDRWRSKSRPALELGPLDSAASTELLEFEFAREHPEAVFPLRADRVVVLQTSPPHATTPRRDVAATYADALLAAERIIYIETQYFTSRTIARALTTRLRDAERPPLQVLILLPGGADNAKEAFALGDLQHQVLSELKAAAEENGHELRLLCSRRGGRDCKETTFIHSKLLLVDDQFLSVGSANMTERSMGLDSELALAWQGESGSELESDIARVRASLLGEHSGMDPDHFLRVAGLVERIDEQVGSDDCRFLACEVKAATSSEWKNAIFDPGSANEFESWATSLLNSPDSERLSRGSSPLNEELERRSRT